MANRAVRKSWGNVPVKLHLQNSINQPNTWTWYFNFPAARHHSKTKAADGPVSVLLKFHKFLQKTKQTNKQKTSQYWTINNWIVDFRYMNTCLWCWYHWNVQVIASVIPVRVQIWCSILAWFSGYNQFTCLHLGQAGNQNHYASLLEEIVPLALQHYLY